MNDVEYDRLTASDRGYTAKWRRERAIYLLDNPLCVLHLSKGRTVAATIIDHIEPHKGNDELFWDQGNWQALCKPCHDRHKQGQEGSGLLVGCGTDGMPDDKNHHWNR